MTWSIASSTSPSHVFYLSQVILQHKGVSESSFPKMFLGTHLYPWLERDPNTMS